jgi:hypothetical protein
MNTLPQRLLVIAHAGIMTVLLLLLSSADWNSGKRQGNSESPQALHLAKVVTSPELHHNLPLA